MSSRTTSLACTSWEWSLCCMKCCTLWLLKQHTAFKAFKWFSGSPNLFTAVWQNGVPKVDAVLHLCIVSESSHRWGPVNLQDATSVVYKAFTEADGPVCLQAQGEGKVQNDSPFSSTKHTCPCSPSVSSELLVQMFRACSIQQRFLTRKHRMITHLLGQSHCRLLLQILLHLTVTDWYLLCWWYGTLAR